jgi:hypothetical protein
MSLVKVMHTFLLLLFVTKNIYFTGFKYYTPTQCIASHPSQFFHGITSLLLDFSLHFNKPISFPPTVTYLDLSIVGIELKYIWPKSLHTLVILNFSPKKLPQHLKILKLKNGFRRPITSLPSSLTELHGEPKVEFYMDELISFPSNLHKLNLFCIKDTPVFPPSVTYIKHLKANSISIPPSITVHTLHTSTTGIIPSSVKRLSFRDWDTVPQLPPHLSHLEIIEKKHHISLPPLPSSLQSLDITGCINAMVPLPPTLTKLKIDDITDDVWLVGSLPPLTYLYCPTKLVESTILPPSLTCLALKSDEYIVLRELKIGNLKVYLVPTHGGPFIID